MLIDFLTYQRETQKQPAPSKPLDWTCGELLCDVSYLQYTGPSEWECTGLFGSSHTCKDIHRNRRFLCLVPREEIYRKGWVRKRFAFEYKRLLTASPSPFLMIPVGWIERVDYVMCILEWNDRVPLQTLLESSQSAPSSSPLPFADPQVRARDALELFFQVATGMKQLHDKTGLIHHNLHPGTLFWSQERQAFQISGFLLSHSLYWTREDEPEFETTFPDNNVSSEDSICAFQFPESVRPYLPPDVLDNPLHAEPCDDIYSLGMIVYQILHNFNDEVVKRFPTDGFETPECGSDGLLTLLRRCLATQRDDRCISWDALLDDVRNMLSENKSRSLQKPQLILSCDDCVNLSWAHIDMSKYSRAGEWANQALDIESNNSFAQIAKMITLGKIGRLDEAFEIGSSLLRREPENAEAHNYMGYLYYQKGDFKTSLEHFESSLRYDSNLACNYNNLTVLYLVHERLKEARDCLMRGLERFPFDPDLLVSWVSVSESLGDLPSALAHLEEKLADDWDGSIHNAYGMVLEKKGRLDDGIIRLEAFLSTRPSAHLAWNRLGILSENAGHLEKSLESFQKAIRLKPHDENYVGNCLRILNSLGCLSEGIQLGEQWLSCYYPAMSVSSLLGVLLTNADEIERAVEPLQNAQRIAPCDETLAGNLVHSLRIADQVNQAIEFGAEWSVTHKGGSYFWNQLGNAYFGLERFAEAIPCYQKALEFEPDDAEIASNLLNAYFKINDFSACMQFAEAWLADHQGNENFHTYLSISFINTNQMEKAISTLKTAISKQPELANSLKEVIAKLTQSGQEQRAIEFGELWLLHNPPTLDVLNQIGIVHYENKRFEEATACFRNALELEPSNKTVALNIMNSYDNLNQYQRCIEFGENWLQHNPPTLDVLNLIGIVHYKNKRFEEATACFQNALELEPSNKTVALNIMNSYDNLNQYQRCIEFGENWLQHNPPTLDVLNLIGIVHYKNKRFEEATACFQNALELEPSNKTVALNIMNSYDNLNQYQRCIEFGEDWLNRHSPDDTIFGHLVDAYTHLGKYDKAEQALVKAPKEYQYLRCILNAYYQSKQFDKAIDCAEQWKDQYNLEPELWNSLGQIHYDKKQYSEALECYEEASRLSPENLDYLNNSALALSSLKKHDEAIARMGYVLEQQPSTLLYAQNYFTCLKDANHKEKAVEFAKGWMEANTVDEILLNSVGLTLDDLKKDKDAIECYQKAHELNPQNAGYLNNMGMSFKALGQFDQAITLTKQAIELEPKNIVIIVNHLICLKSADRLDEAIQIGNAWIQEHGEKPIVLNQLALIHEQKFDFENALVCYDSTQEKEKYLAALIDYGRYEALNQALEWYDWMETA